MCKEPGITWEEIKDAHLSIVLRNPNFCKRYWVDQQPPGTVKEHPLREWQSELLQILKTEPDDRTINFVVDVTGNQGKSWFADWYWDKNEIGTQIMQPGKVADMAYNLIEKPKVVFMDCPRSKQGEYIQYDFLEHMKNGLVFSPKYDSRTKRFKPPHVVVFMNEEPDRTKLSADRYNVIQI